MLQIISNIPVFVWPLFIVLLLGGLKARKTNTVPLNSLLLFPCGFFIWSFFSFIEKYAIDPIMMIFWFVCLGIGFFIGFSHMQKAKLRFDREQKKVELPSSWLPLILSMSIFSVKFSIGMISSILPHLNESFLILGLEFFATIILGIFIGRGMGCLVRYKATLIEN